MMEILENYGGWPVVKGDKWNEKEWDWIEINKKMSVEGLEDTIIFSLSIVTDQRNSSKRILDVRSSTIIINHGRSTDLDDNILI